MKQAFTIHGKLPGLNDLIHAINHNRFTGNRMKQQAQTEIGWAIKAAHLKSMTAPIRVHVAWYEPNKRRDPDNITSAIKYILDVLQPPSRRNPGGLGIIQGDSQASIAGVPTHELHVDRLHPHIVVTLEEVHS